MKYDIGQANRLGNRKNNQDRFLAVEENGCVLLIMADGMGGQEGGELAAEILVNTLRDEFLSANPPLKVPEKFIDRSLLKAHHNVIMGGQEHDPPITPATTAVVCLIQNGVANWGHIGDSRLYLFRKGMPIFRTRDHSLVEELYQKGLISRAEQETHPRRNQLTQCVGSLFNDPDLALGTTTPLEEGDALLLCSDGLWGAIEDAQLGLTLATESMEDAAQNLAEQAEKNSYPNSDNVSVLLFQLNQLDAPDVLHQENKLSAHTDEQDESEILRSAIEQIENTFRQYENELYIPSESESLALKEALTDHYDTPTVETTTPLVEPSANEKPLASEKNPPQDESTTNKNNQAGLEYLRNALSQVEQTLKDYKKNKP